MAVEPMAGTRARASVRALRFATVVLAGLLLGTGTFWIVTIATQPRRNTPVYDPPVLAGQQLWRARAGGFYARHGDTIGFTPLAEGLAELGLDLCTTPDCGLVPPVAEVAEDGR